jgi:hypothetical protein
MIIKLTRLGVFEIGIFLTIMFILVNRLSFIKQSEITKGVVTEIYVSSSSGGRYSNGKTLHPRVKFETDSFVIEFKAVSNMDVKVGDSVNVIYLKKDPIIAEVFSFIGFLYMPILYGFLFNLLIITPPIFSLMTKNTILILDLTKIFRSGFITKTELIDIN